MTAPLGVQVNPRITAVSLTAPFSVLLLLPKETGVPMAVNSIVPLTTDAIAAASLGDTTKYGRQWYDLIEGGSNVHIAALAFDPASYDDNAVAALNAVLNPDEIAKIPGGNIDLVVTPDYTGRVNTASPIVTKLEQVCVDNGGIGAIAVVDAYLTTSDQAWVTTWLTNNAAANILPITNGAPISGSAGSFRGAAAAAYHLCHYAAQRGIGVHPFNLTDPVIGMGIPAPQRVLQLDNAGSAAETLKQAYGSSFITYDGSEYLWGGKLKTATSGDPRQDFANAMVAHRMVKRGRQALVSTLGRRATSFLLSEAALAVELTLAREFGAYIESIAVGAPVLTGTHLQVPVSVGFYDFVESAALVVDIFHAEVQA